MAAKRVTDADKIQFNELYLQYGTYAAVARETGFSPTTVKKYIVSDYVSSSAVAENIIPFDKEIVDVQEITFPNNRKEFYELFILTEKEREDCEELRKEILL